METVKKSPQTDFEEFKEAITNENKTSLFPTNVVELPSKGFLYQEDNLLSLGTVEMKFMTAKEENILTTESYIKQGIVIDKFLQSMVIGPKFNYDSLLIGDKDALVVASRIYGYGEIYPIEVETPSGKKQKVEIDLTTLKSKEVDEDLFTKGENRFFYETPLGKNRLEFKLLTVGDQKKIDEKLKKYKKAGDPDTQISSRLSTMIISVDGNSDPHFIELFIANDLRSRDSRSFREYIASISPGVDMEIELVDEDTLEPFRSKVAIGADFFWPDIRV